MHQDLHDAVVSLLRRRPQESVRVLKAYDGRRVLQCCDPPTVVQLELNGRPDGLRFGGHDTALAMLQQRGGAESGACGRVAPQEWMELDREYTQFHQRRRAAILAAVQADIQGDPPLAEYLYRRAIVDAEHCLAIVAFAWDKHPRGRLSAAGPAGRPAILVQRITAGGLLRLLAGDAAGAVAQVAAGIEEILRLLGHEGEQGAQANIVVRDLEALKAHLCAATVQANTKSASDPADASGHCTRMSQPIAL